MSTYLAPDAARTERLEARFRELAHRWREECAVLSSTTAKAMHPAYQQIIGLGPDALVGRSPVELAEELGHFRLPSCIYFGYRHGGLSSGKVLALEVADEGAVIAEEQRVVVPSRLLQGGAHLRPHVGMPAHVLLAFVSTDVQPETDALCHCLFTGRIDGTGVVSLVLVSPGHGPTGAGQLLVALPRCRLAPG